MVLELQSRTIIAPIILHSSINSIGVSRLSNVCPLFWCTLCSRQLVCITTDLVIQQHFKKML